MPGFPNTPLVLTVTDTLANIAPSVGNVANYYVWLVNEGSGVVYGPSAATTSAGSWTLASIPVGTYKPFYGTQGVAGVAPVRWQVEGTSPYEVGPPRNSSIPSGGFPSWSAALAKAAAGTGIANVMFFGASIAGLGGGGTAVTDVLTKPYGAVWRAAKRLLYTTHGDSFLPTASSGFNSGVTSSVFPWTMDVSPALWGYYGPMIAPAWVTATTMPLCHATHASAALGYNARSARVFVWDGGNQDGGSSGVGRTFHGRVNVDGATDQTYTVLGDNKIHTMDFLNLPDQVGNVINLGNQGAASAALIPICISWYPTTTIPTSGIHYSWFGIPGSFTMFDLARTDGTVTKWRIERLIGPSNAPSSDPLTTPFTANAALSPPFAPDLVFLDVLDDLAFVNIPTSSGATPAFTVNGGPFDFYMAGLGRLCRAFRQKSTGCDIVHHMPNFATGLVSDTTVAAAYQLQNAYAYYAPTKAFAEMNGHGWLNTDAEWRELGLAGDSGGAYFLAANPHPTDRGHAEIAARITAKLGL